jgi:hypothetical protein
VVVNWLQYSLLGQWRLRPHNCLALKKNKNSKVPVGRETKSTERKIIELKCHIFYTYYLTYTSATIFYTWNIVLIYRDRSQVYRGGKGLDSTLKEGNLWARYCTYTF